MNSMRWIPALLLGAALGAALGGAGCSDSRTPTEPPPRVLPPTPVPANTWTGTFSGASIACSSSASVVFDSSGNLPTGAKVPCLADGFGFQLSLSRQGNALTGYAMWGDPEFFPVTGMLTDSAMELTIFNDTLDFPTGPTGPIGTMHLHP